MEREQDFDNEIEIDLKDRSGNPYPTFYMAFGIVLCNYDSMPTSGKSAFTASGAAYKHCSSCSADFVRMP